MSNALISTLHFYNNYGSVLQAYALREVLIHKMGCSADIFPYIPQIPDHKYFEDNELTKLYEKKVDKFKKFRERYLNMSGINSRTVQGAFEILGKQLDDYELFIAGSDIIWGREFSNLDPVYFLRFAPGTKKCIAYAASVVLDENGHSENDSLFYENLKKFRQISVRETSAVAPIQLYSDNVKVESVIDPTLLVGTETYEELEENISDFLGEPYLLAYFLTHDPAAVDYTNCIAKKFGLRVIHYWADYPKHIFNETTKCFAFTGPGEFLSLVRNAKLIFTNSFHGTCFSVIYRKPFYTYMAKRNLLSRVRDTIEKLGLEERFFYDFNDMVRVTTDIDYSDMENRLKNLQRDSIDFLRMGVNE